LQIVIVGGPHSGVGKTLACEVALRALDGLGFGAIKLTVADGERDPHDHGRSALVVAEAAGICGRGASCGVCETVSGKIPSRLITHQGAIRKPNTDTWRLTNAGAVAVAWVIALRSGAPEAVARAIDHLSEHGARGVVIEGTTALEWIRPQLSVMVATEPGKKWKAVAVNWVGRCDIVLRNLVPQLPGREPVPQVFRDANPTLCDLADLEHPGTADFMRRVRAGVTGAAHATI
jgi:hypothetical protein